MNKLSFLILAFALLSITIPHAASQEVEVTVSEEEGSVLVTVENETETPVAEGAPVVVEETPVVVVSEEAPVTAEETPVVVEEASIVDETVVVPEGGETSLDNTVDGGNGNDATVVIPLESNVLVTSAALTLSLIAAYIVA